MQRAIAASAPSPAAGTSRTRDHGGAASTVVPVQFPSNDGSPGVGRSIRAIDFSTERSDPSVPAEPHPNLENDLAGTDLAFANGRTRHLLLAISVVLSIALHGLPVAAFMFWPSRIADFGVLDRETEAVSVELVSSNVLEALEAQQITEAAAAQQAVVMPEGNAPQDKAEARPEDTTKPEEQVIEKIEEPVAAPKKEGAASDEPAPVEAERTEVPTQKSQAEREAPLAQPKEQIAEQKRQQERQEKKEASQAAKKGGISVSATQGSEARRPKLSASTGEMRSYAATVRAHLAAHKPSGSRRSGTVVVSFGLTPEGRLAFARVNSSSGSEYLDERALAAIRRCEPFPSPPRGATPRQLRYSIPIYFK